MIGGLSEEEEDDADFGIFVRSILPGGVAANDGRYLYGILLGLTIFCCERWYILGIWNI